MQIFISMAIICCTTYIGFGLAEYYVRREKLFFELVALCERLRADIGFLLKPIDKILEESCRGCRPLLANILNICGEMLKCGKVLSSEEVYARIGSKYLDEEEQRLIAGFFSVLGKSDALTQIESIDFYKVRFSACENSAREERKRFSPMLKKLGFLCGAAICLFMI